ncbi:hypothetical protein CLOM_g15109 [Closterium sp. NIES-68]|nr:hypothetical protein CLOM_g15109 [Closterium sp. NIES-68]
MSMLGKRGLCRHDPHAAFAHRGKEKVTRLDEVAIWARTLQRLKDGARAVFTASASPPSADAHPAHTPSAAAPIVPQPDHMAHCPARPAPVEDLAQQGFPHAAPPSASPVLRHWWQPAAVGQQRRAQGQAGPARAGGGLGDVANSGVRTCCCGGSESAAHTGGTCMRCSHGLCNHCTCVCAACNQPFCDNCTVTNYDLRVDRFFCLDCSHHHHHY